MPWVKQFDEAAVLEKAMQAFWARGYEATSVRDLVACTGLNRGSLYASFGDKRSLFLMALQHYETHQRRAWLAALRRRHGPRAAILALFEGAIAAALADRSRAGCFLINTAVELAAHDEEVARLVAAGLCDTEAYFRDLVAEGQGRGEIAAEADPDDTARALLGLLTGLRVLARSRPERPLLEALADQAARLVGR